MQYYKEGSAEQPVSRNVGLKLPRKELEQILDLT